ncbi:nodulation S family protein [Caballeronia sp. SEWSISQ10-4 2]|uniref:class I SAM-dependent DNA methyltransferase n=1 Tax=Caballeronia sp. SEWSISQ10-4 2 TaxID=2937438 RepID=UPI00265727AD|nr:SAM-dependent methyltransferase [Caballeronia sp. SEWSISQ10-4 2]MDN7177481.1 nodulation S family protein [Caballeronia sp. SEWSISQ10-4 2]
MTPGSDAQDYFAGLYQSSNDPWLLRERWYERRKRALTLATLPDEHYRRAYEPGCANGELTAELAPRCDTLLAADLNPAAVELARQRVVHLQHVRVEQRVMPDDWPDGEFDLIVVSEVAYYLNERQLAGLIARLTVSLAKGGTLIACHWRRPIAGWPHSGDHVHGELRAKLALPLLSQYQDDDMVLDAWSSNGASVHQREAR